MNDAPSSSQLPRGGLAQYFSAQRGVAWLCLVMLLGWGWFAFRSLPQQEDPKIPDRRAVIVTVFPGATADKVEELVTKPLEKKSSELASMEEIRSESRHGLSVIYVTLQPEAQARVEQDWEKLRAKLLEVRLPEGARAPWLNTDFGSTLTLLYALASQPLGEAELAARAAIIRSAIAEARAGRPAVGRAAAATFYPDGVSKEVRDSQVARFCAGLQERGLAADLHTVVRGNLVAAEFATAATREQLGAFLNDFVRTIGGTDGEPHPDFHMPVILLGAEDPLPALRALHLPRHSYRTLEKAAEDFEDELKQIDTVGRTQRLAIVPETIYLDYSSANLNALKLGRAQLAGAVAARNAIIPGGTFRTEGQNFPVQVSGEFKNESELLGAVVGASPDGMPEYLRDVFTVTRGYENPIGFHFGLFDRATPDAPLLGRRAVLLSVEMRAGAKIGDFYASAQAVEKRFRSRLPDGLDITTISNQPVSVDQRVRLFLKAFFEAVVIVVLVALFLMDWRSALVVATAIPLTVAATFAGMQIFGIPLHQISIAGLIITLGVLVDNPVVAADGINRELANGRPRDIAAWLGCVRLARPITFGTIINIAAFLPLVLMPGDKGVFIYSLPVVVTLSLAASRVVSMTFTPLLGYYVLKGQKGFEAGAEVRSFFLFKWIDLLLLWFLPRYRRLLERALRNPVRTVAIVYGLLLLSFGLLPFFGTQFFPPADRNQFVIDVELTKSASPAQMREVVDGVAQFLGRYDRIENFGAFYGGSAPRFYYNVRPKEAAPYLAQILVNTRSAEDVVPMMADIRKRVDAVAPGARIVARQLEQGPPVDFPIQLRFAGPDLDVLCGLAGRAAAILRQHEAYKVFDDLGQRLPTLKIDIDQERANTLGVDNLRVGALTLNAFGAARITDLREGDHLIPVVVRLRTEERREADQLQSLYVESARGTLIPLESFAKITVEPAFATIPHFNQLRTVTVNAMAPVGVLPSAILQSARAELRAIPMAAGYSLTFAGEDKELKESRSEMGLVMIVSLAAIFLAIVVQFRSVAKAMAVMVTVPLGLFGAFIGLTLFHTTLGFMALLAIVSLAGVIVSHIIVLSDFIEEARAEGMPLREALVHAGLVRLRPVIVTVFCTVCGLIPLAVEGGELWHPLTAVHIVGLLCATGLTLVVLPVIYLLFAEKLKWIK
jgi:multidrug efflux pump